MAELLVLLVVLAIAIALGQFLFAHLGAIAQILVALLGLGAAVWLIDAVSSVFSQSSSRGGSFTTLMGTPYRTLRELALHCVFRPGRSPISVQCDQPFLHTLERLDLLQRHTCRLRIPVVDDAWSARLVEIRVNRRSAPS